MGKKRSKKQVNLAREAWEFLKGSFGGLCYLAGAIIKTFFDDHPLS